MLLMMIINIQDVKKIYNKLFQINYKIIQLIYSNERIISFRKIQSYRNQFIINLPDDY